MTTPEPAGTPPKAHRCVAGEDETALHRPTEVPTRRQPGVKPTASCENRDMPAWAVTDERTAVFVEIMGFD